jgi:hypothetical protein
MPPPVPRSPWLLYVTTLAVCVTVIVASVALIGRASSPFMTPGEREKTALALQVETAREIRAALKRPIVVPPLPPITAQPLHEVRSAAQEPETPRPRVQAIPAAAMDAMAMDLPAGPQPYNPLLDRHRLQ